MKKSTSLEKAFRFGQGTTEMKKSTFVKGYLFVKEYLEEIMAGLVIMLIVALMIWGLFFPHTRHYYRVVANGGKVYEVAEFAEPSRHNRYYQGLVNGERYVFTNIESYSRMEKTYVIKYF